MSPLLLFFGFWQFLLESFVLCFGGFVRAVCVGLLAWGGVPVCC